MHVAAADGFTQLVFHLLAHVPRPGPGDLYDRHHVDASARHFGAATRALLTSDAATLAALWRGPALDVLDALPDLHASLAAFRRTAARALGELTADDVACPEVLVALQRLGAPAELVHATMGLIADEFARVHAEVIEPSLRLATGEVEASLAPLASTVPGLTAARIELVWALGSRGRALPGRLLVGSPRADLDPRLPAVVAVHEHAVCTSGHVDYLRAEWSALVRGARWLRPTPLRDAHARWLASLDLSAIVAGALSLGLVAPDDAEPLRRDRHARGELLAALPG